MSELEKRLTKIYSRVEKELAKKASSFFERFEEADKKHKKLMEEGKLTEKEYQKWRINALMTGKRYKQMQKDVTETLLNVNKVAASYINDEIPGVYADNFNRVGQDAEQKVSGYSFDLVSAETVKNLATEDTTLLPYKYVDGRKDERWNTKKINSEILQGIIQGESIPKIAKRLGNVTEMNKVSAVRNARTAVTGAQNSGRFNGMKQLEKDGVILKKEWVAAVDSHTREAHLELNGKQVDIDEPFVVDGKEIMFPGDPECPYPELVYNCRCAIRTVIIGFKPRSENKVEEEVSRPIIQGKDISDNWMRRPDDFQFEIQDVMNAQGFDGLPQLVNQEEFDKAVEQSHFIAQRTYSAPDQETLDAYRDMLYNGEWYVDCSTGGAQYGQGMYCAANYNGQLTSGIKKEMAHYQELGAQRAQESGLDNLTAKEFNKQSGWSLTNEEYQAHKRANDVGWKGLSENEKKIINASKHNIIDFDDALTNIKIPEAVSYVETFTLTPDAKVITWEQGIKEAELNYAKHKYDLSDDDIDILRDVASKKGRDYMNAIEELAQQDYELVEMWNEALEWGIDKLEGGNGDLGVELVKLGYDAINAEGHGESGSYTVILNRTKCIILNGGLKK